MHEHQRLARLPPARLAILGVSGKCVNIASLTMCTRGLWLPKWRHQYYCDDDVKWNIISRLTCWKWRKWLNTVNVFGPFGPCHTRQIYRQPVPRNLHEEKPVTFQCSPNFLLDRKRMSEKITHGLQNRETRRSSVGRALASFLGHWFKSRSIVIVFFVQHQLLL